MEWNYLKDNSKKEPFLSFQDENQYSYWTDPKKTFYKLGFVDDIIWKKMLIRTNASQEIKEKEN